MISLDSVRDFAVIAVATVAYLVVDGIGFVRELLLPDLGDAG